MEWLPNKSLPHKVRGIFESTLREEPGPASARRAWLFFLKSRPFPAENYPTGGRGADLQDILYPGWTPPLRHRTQCTSHELTGVESQKSISIERPHTAAVVATA